ARVPDGVWREAVRAVPFLGRLDSAAQARLRELATVFLYEKDLHGAGGLELDATMRLTVAAQACLPVLNLGLDYYRDWITVVVYPDEFVPPGDYTDDAGVVHYRRAPLTGEAWLR
ncbi:MAG: zinc-dependent peptidase, partial [Gammaproteobacteria bacterium]|nr:zinc-dependent peptidase [Gammaproteobacteria bacterium]